MALPGTELFRSLYDAGRIKINRKYFRHILNSLAPVPSQTYCDSLSRIDLALWKVKLFRRFYSSARRDGDGGLVRAVSRAIGGVLRRGDHKTKMETAVRHAFTTGMETILASFRPRYMKLSDERSMFASWDDIYLRIYEQKLACGAIARMPLDTTELHRANIIPTLVR